MAVSQSQVSDSISFIFLGCVGHWFWPQPTVDVVESILYICVPWLDFSDRNIFQHRVLFFKKFLLTKILQIRLEFSLTSHPLYIVLCPSTSVTSYIFSTARCFKPNKQWKQIENFSLKLPSKNVLLMPPENFPSKVFHPGPSDQPGHPDLSCVPASIVCWYSRKWQPPICGGLRQEKLNWVDFLAKLIHLHMRGPRLIESDQKRKKPL